MNPLPYLAASAFALAVVLSGCSAMHTEIQQRCVTAPDPAACHTAEHLRIQEHERERFRQAFTP